MVAVKTFEVGMKDRRGITIWVMWDRHARKFIEVRRTKPKTMTDRYANWWVKFKDVA